MSEGTVDAAGEVAKLPPLPVHEGFDLPGEGAATSCQSSSVGVGVGVGVGIDGGVAHSPVDECVDGEPGVREGST